MMTAVAYAYHSCFSFVFFKSPPEFKNFNLVFVSEYCTKSLQLLDFLGNENPRI